jgi:hypothetical protein
LPVIVFSQASPEKEDPAFAPRASVAAKASIFAQASMDKMADRSARQKSLFSQ